MLLVYFTCLNLFSVQFYIGYIALELKKHDIEKQSQKETFTKR
jgi:hypothetical protein